MTFLLLACSVLSLSFALATQELPLIILAAFFLALLLSIVVYDLYQLRSHTLLLLKASRGTAPKPILSMTALLADVLDMLKVRLNNLHNEVALLSGTKGREEILEGGDWLKTELRQISERFGAGAAAVLLPTRDRMRFESSAALGKRFEGQLLGLTESWMQRGETFFLGKRDALSDKGFWGDFAVFGYVSYVLEPLAWSDTQGQEVRGALWIGFKSGRDISASATQLLRSEARSFEAQIVQHLQLESLEERAREAEAKSEHKSEFIAHMSHDIRSPLNNVRAIFHLLQNEGAFSDEVQEFIQAGLISCENVSEMLETLLDYSKMKANKLSALKSPVRLQEVVREGVLNFELSARQKKILFTVEADANRNFVVEVDKRQIKRILFNLLSNAVKYTDEGSITVSIAEHGRTVSLRIQDTGRGMGAEQMQKLFIPFERMTNDAVEGIGLGLLVTKGLIELNKGTLKVESTPGIGTSFLITFPVSDVSPEKLSGGRDENIISFASIQCSALVPFSRSALLVDDDIEASASLRKLLEKSGFEVMVAHSVSEALSVLTFEKPGCIISDLTMPDGGGRRLLSEVKSRFDGLPFLFLTGEGDAALHAELLEEGAQSVLQKPVDFSRLKKALGTIG